MKNKFTQKDMDNLLEVFKSNHQLKRTLSLLQNNVYKAYHERIRFGVSKGFIKKDTQVIWWDMKEYNSWLKTL